MSIFVFMDNALMQSECRGCCFNTSHSAGGMCEHAIK